MQHYINQLLQDFGSIDKPLQKAVDFGSTYNEFAEAMKQIEDAENVEAKSVLRVSYEELPPADMLTETQMEQLLGAIIDALDKRGTQVSFPGDNPPLSLRYSALREHFKDGFHAMPGWNIDFCDGDCPSCEFAEYCKSKVDFFSN